MVFRTIVILLTAIVSFLNCEAARNLVPKEIREDHKGESRYYVVAGDETVDGYLLSKKGVTAKSFMPGDTLYVQEIFNTIGPENDLSRYNIKIDGEAAFIVLSINNKELAVIERSKLEKADMRSEAEKEADLIVQQKKEAGNRAIAQVKGLFQGDNSYPFDVTYSLIAFVIATIICYRLSSGNSNDILVTVLIPAVILIIVYYFQYQLFVNGEKALSDWTKSDPMTNVFLSMLRLFGSVIFLFVFTLWEIYLMYVILRRIGMFCLGRTNYLLSFIIWMGGSVAMAIVAIFFKEHSYTALKVILGIFGLDILISIIMNRKNIILMIITAVFYVAGAFALVPSYAVSGYAFFWIVGCIMAIGLICLLCQPAKIVGSVFGAFGQIGTLMSDGTVNLLGGGSFNVSNLNPRNYIKMNDD